MKAADPIDTARLALLLAELRLPAVKQIWADLAAQADKEGWPAARFLAALAEHEMAERSRRRIERHLAEAKLPPGKTLDTFDFEAVPVISKAQVMALAAGDAWLNQGANLILFGPPGAGKSHLAAALGFALVEKGALVRAESVSTTANRSDTRCLPGRRPTWPTISLTARRLAPALSAKRPDWPTKRANSVRLEVSLIWATPYTGHKLASQFGYLVRAVSSASRGNSVLLS